MLAVVDEAMTDTGARRKSCEVSGPHRVKVAVYPGIDLTFKYVHKLFLFLLGMRPGAPLSGHQSLQVDADLEEAGSFADAALIAGIFVAVRILMALLRT